MRTTSSRALAGAAALTLGLLTVGATSATASSSSHGGGGGGGGVRAAGACSAASTWKLKAKPDDGQVQVEYEVDSNVVGQTWSFAITDNGKRVAAGTAKTVGPSESFSVERVVSDAPGSDRIVATATNAATGESCRGVVTLPA